MQVAHAAGYERLVRSLPAVFPSSREGIFRPCHRTVNGVPVASAKSSFCAYTSV